MDVCLSAVSVVCSDKTCISTFVGRIVYANEKKDRNMSYMLRSILNTALRVGPSIVSKIMSGSGSGERHLRISHMKWNFIVLFFRYNEHHSFCRQLRDLARSIVITEAATENFILQFVRLISSTFWKASNGEWKERYPKQLYMDQNIKRNEGNRKRMRR